MKSGWRRMALRSSRSPPTRILTRTLRKPETVLACLAYFFLLIGYYGIAFWLPQLIKGAGISDTMTIGWLSALPWLAAGLTVVFVGPFFGFFGTEEGGADHRHPDDRGGILDECIFQ